MSHVFATMKVGVTATGSHAVINTETGQVLLIVNSTMPAETAAAVTDALNMHGELLEALHEAAKLMPLGTAKRARWVTKAIAAIAKAEGRS